jgi:phosphotransferase system enzyme I (PtsI)
MARAFRCRCAARWRELALGLEELSMTSGQIPVVKRIIRSVTMPEAKDLLAKAMEFSTAEEIERFVKSEMDTRFAAEG